MNCSSLILSELELASVAELGKTTPQTGPNWASICAYHVCSISDIFRLDQSWSDSVRPDKIDKAGVTNQLSQKSLMHLTLAAAFALFLGSIFSRLSPDLPELRFHFLWHTHMSFIIFIYLCPLEKSFHTTFDRSKPISPDFLQFHAALSSQANPAQQPSRSSVHLNTIWPKAQSCFGLVTTTRSNLKTVTLSLFQTSNLLYALSWLNRMYG